MNIFFDWASWLWQQFKAVVLIVAHQNWGAFKMQHLVALIVIYLIWRVMLRPIILRLRLFYRFKGQIRGKHWQFGRVLNVVDGDTIDVRISWFRKARVRMLYIDAPESKQSRGEHATRFVKRHAKGNTVLLVCAKNNDRYGRILAEVFCAHLRHSLNLTMVENGLAWAYNGTKAYTVAQQTARRKKVGLWHDRRPMNPAEWRSKGKHS